MTKNKHTLFGICRQLGKCICGLCKLINNSEDATDLEGLEKHIDQHTNEPGNRKPRVPMFIGITVTKEGWYTE